MPDPNFQSSLPKTPPDAPGVVFDLEERKMLTTIRDTLYEGRWEDFAMDLRARLSGQPYVFAVQPLNPKLRETIRHHLDLIEQLMKRGE